MHKGQVDAVQATVAYHENFRETVLNIESWNCLFDEFPDLITQARTSADVDHAKATDPGITRMDRQVVHEMNRVGQVVQWQPRLWPDRGGLAAVGMDAAEIAGIMGGNWYRLYTENFGPE